METIIVTKHAAVEQYIREAGLCDDESPCFPSVSAEYVKGKHVIGIVPFHIAASAALFTEIKLTLRKHLFNTELTLDQLKAMVQQVRTYEVNVVNSLK